MNSLKKYLPIALAIGFFIFGLSAFLESKPSHKDRRIYTIVQKYSPYYLNKRFGGIEILSKEDSNFKKKPTNMELFRQLEALEKEWAKRHLKLDGKNLIIVDNNNTKLETIPIKKDKEMEFINLYYGITK